MGEGIGRGQVELLGSALFLELGAGYTGVLGVGKFTNVRF